jgi:hypothetical protein
MIKAEGEELKMPNFDLKPQEISALTTFLMGSVDPTLPKRYFDQPEDYRKDVQDGWWLVKKYNCMGCHQFKVGQDSALMQNPRYQTPEWKDQLPPKLLAEGARVTTEWLMKFLPNPAMSDTDTNRNGVRPYLKARMPTFYFSPLEVRKLVRFFQAQSAQPIPYIPPKPEPLTAQELTLARDRLKAGWTKRWLLDPSMISPGTAMPSGLFKRDGSRWVFSGPTPPIFGGYAGDQADLLVRYMFEITPDEQRRLMGMSAGAVASGGRNPGRDPGNNTFRLRPGPVATLARAHQEQVQQ